MSSLADSFLEDLDELNESDSDENEEDEEFEDKNIDPKSESDEDAEHPESSAQLIKIVAKEKHKIDILRSSVKYNKTMSEVRSALERGISNESISGVLEDDPEYRLVLSCNKLIQEIEEDIAEIHRYTADLYAKKFPELESLITNKIDYIKILLRIGNETDLTLVEFNDLLPSSLVMVVSVTGSTTSGTPLSESDLSECQRGCREILSLDDDKSLLLRFVERCMNRIAPNLCHLIGPRFSAMVVGLAGGLTALSKIPSCNIQVIGQEKRHLAGFSNIAALPHTGLLYYTDLVQDCPPFLRKRALKVVSAKVALLSRVDSYKLHPNGEEGERMRKEVSDKIDKWQDPPKARTKKALPIPEEKRKSKRGGKRVRKMKERFAMTELRSQQNKISFSTDVGEYGDSAMGNDAGMIGLTHGNVRATVSKKNKKLKLSSTTSNVASGGDAQSVVRGAGGGGGGVGGVGGGMKSIRPSGTASTLTFTPVQGIELVNPQAQAEKLRAVNAKWFSSTSGFLSAPPKR